MEKTQLTRILRDHPELQKVPVTTIDQIVVEFLKLHDVEARPPKNTSRRDGAIAGAITGIIFTTFFGTNLSDCHSLRPHTLYSKEQLELL